MLMCEEGLGYEFQKYLEQEQLAEANSYQESIKKTHQNISYHIVNIKSEVYDQIPLRPKSCHISEYVDHPLSHSVSSGPRPQQSHATPSPCHTSHSMLNSHLYHLRQEKLSNYMMMIDSPTTMVQAGYQSQPSSYGKLRFLGRREGEGPVMIGQGQNCNIPEFSSSQIHKRTETEQIKEQMESGMKHSHVSNVSGEYIVDDVHAHIDPQIINPNSSLHLLGMNSRNNLQPHFQTNFFNNENQQKKLDNIHYQNNYMKLNNQDASKIEDHGENHQITSPVEQALIDSDLKALNNSQLKLVSHPFMLTGENEIHIRDEGNTDTPVAPLSNNRPSDRTDIDDMTNASIVRSASSAGRSEKDSSYNSRTTSDFEKEAIQKIEEEEQLLQQKIEQLKQLKKIKMSKGGSQTAVHHSRRSRRSKQHTMVLDSRGSRVINESDKTVTHKFQSNGEIKDMDIHVELSSNNPCLSITQKKIADMLIEVDAPIQKVEEEKSGGFQEVQRSNREQMGEEEGQQKSYFNDRTEEMDIKEVLQQVLNQGHNDQPSEHRQDPEDATYLSQPSQQKREFNTPPVEKTKKPERNNMMVQSSSNASENIERDVNKTLEGDEGRGEELNESAPPSQREEGELHKEYGNEELTPEMEMNDEEKAQEEQQQNKHDFIVVGSEDLEQESAVSHPSQADMDMDDEDDEEETEVKRNTTNLHSNLNSNSFLQDQRDMSYQFRQNVLDHNALGNIESDIHANNFQSDYHEQKVAITSLNSPYPQTKPLSPHLTNVPLNQTQSSKQMCVNDITTNQQRSRVQSAMILSNQPGAIKKFNPRSQLPQSLTPVPHQDTVETLKKHNLKIQYQIQKCNEICQSAINKQSSTNTKIKFDINEIGEISSMQRTSLSAKRITPDGMSSLRQLTSKHEQGASSPLNNLPQLLDKRVYLSQSRANLNLDNNLDLSGGQNVFPFSTSQDDHQNISGYNYMDNSNVNNTNVAQNGMDDEIEEGEEGDTCNEEEHGRNGVQFNQTMPNVAKPKIISPSNMLISDGEDMIIAKQHNNASQNQFTCKAIVINPRESVLSRNNHNISDNVVSPSIIQSSNQNKGRQSKSRPVYQSKIRAKSAKSMVQQYRTTNSRSSTAKKSQTLVNAHLNRKGAGIDRVHSAVHQQVNLNHEAAIPFVGQNIYKSENGIVNADYYYMQNGKNQIVNTHGDIINVDDDQMYFYNNIQNFNQNSQNQNGQLIHYVSNKVKSVQSRQTNESVNVKSFESQSKLRQRINSEIQNAKQLHQTQERFKDSYYAHLNINSKQGRQSVGAMSSKNMNKNLSFFLNSPLNGSIPSMSNFTTNIDSSNRIAQIQNSTSYTHKEFKHIMKVQNGNKESRNLNKTTMGLRNNNHSLIEHATGIQTSNPKTATGIQSFKRKIRRLLNSKDKVPNTKILNGNSCKLVKNIVKDESQIYDDLVQKTLYQISMGNNRNISEVGFHFGPGARRILSKNSSQLMPKPKARISRYCHSRVDEIICQNFLSFIQKYDSETSKKIISEALIPDIDEQCENQNHNYKVIQQNMQKKHVFSIKAALHEKNEPRVNTQEVPDRSSKEGQRQNSPPSNHSITNDDTICKDIDEIDVSVTKEKMVYIEDDENSELRVEIPTNNKNDKTYKRVNSNNLEIEKKLKTSLGKQQLLDEYQKHQTRNLSAFQKR